MRVGWFRKGGLAWFGVLVAAGVGCDSASILPPQPKALKSASSVASGARAKELVVVFPGDDSLEYRIWEQLALVEAGREKVTYRVFRPDSKGAKDAQAEEQAKFVKEAVAQGASGIIILPVDPKAIAPALAEAEKKKATVVVLNREVQKPGSSETFRLIRPTGNLEFSKRILDAIFDDLKREKLDLKAKTILVSDKTDDPLNLERTASFEDSAKKAGLDIVAKVVVSGEPTDAQNQLAEVLKKHPDVKVVLVDGDLALNGAVMIRGDAKSKYAYLIGAYTSTRAGVDSSRRRPMPRPSLAEVKIVS
jgi:ABC-type sugar transport system substrate-binding protein